MTSCDVFLPFMFAHLLCGENFGGRTVPSKAAWVPGLPGLVACISGGTSGLPEALLSSLQLAFFWHVSFTSAFSSNQLQTYLASSLTGNPSPACSYWLYAGPGNKHTGNRAFLGALVIWNFTDALANEKPHFKQLAALTRLVILSWWDWINFIYSVSKACCKQWCDSYLRENIARLLYDKTWK